MILVITTVASVIQTGDATVKVMWDVPVTRLDVIATEMMDVGPICTALSAIMMLGVMIFAATVIVTGDATVKVMRDAPVTRLNVIVIEMKGAELMVSVQPMTICLVVSVRDIISATATEMMDVGTICTALSAIMMLGVVILTIVVVMMTGDAPPVILIRDAPVTRLDVIVIEMIDVGTICTALSAILMVSVVILTIVVVMMTGTVPLATVSATGS